jgi:hypothetical protein
MLLTAVAVQADKPDDHVKAKMQKQRICGLSLAVVKEGKTIKELALIRASAPRALSAYRSGRLLAARPAVGRA